jgi:hypothetical protein
MYKEVVCFHLFSDVWGIVIFIGFVYDIESIKLI